MSGRPRLEVTTRTRGCRRQLPGLAGRFGRRIVGYDNERGKGDHCHRRDREEPYRFTTVE